MQDDKGIVLGHGSHTGCKRDHNEDTYDANARHKLWLVADGMGGHDHGEVASAIARNVINRAIEQGHSLNEAIQQANTAIINESLKQGDNLPMGTTIAALQIDGDAYEIAWVGDSRIYLYDGEGLHALSKDHSYVQELMDQNLITASQARTHPHRNVVTQALGVTSNEELKVATAQGKIPPAAKFLLCSDGLTEEINDTYIENILAKDLHPQELADQLILAALEAGGSDNITVLVIAPNT
jgi:protein phosphatase